MYSLSKNIIKQALDLSPVATLIVDLKSQPATVVYANQAFEAVSGFDSGELYGLHWAKLCGQECNAVEAPPAELSVACHPRLGETDPLQMDFLPLYDRPGAPRYWVGTEQPPASDTLVDTLTEREALLSVLRDARMHLRRLDGRDSVTGLLSRQAFSDLLERDWVLARREQRQLALVLFRLDGYAGYRDVFGRHAADSCLRKVSHAITGSLRRAGDLVARYGDDQLVVLMGHAGAEQAAKLAEQIALKVRGLAIHHPRSANDRFVTVSYSCASMRPHGIVSSSELLARAEHGLCEPDPSATLPLHGLVAG